jgi:hypothetical protein
MTGVPPAPVGIRPSQWGLFLALLDAGLDGMSTSELYPIGGGRFGARLAGLKREFGVEFVSARRGDNLQQYWLVSWPQDLADEVTSPLPMRLRRRAKKLRLDGERRMPIAGRRRQYAPGTGRMAA